MTEERYRGLAVRHRRALHQIPELDDELPKTCAYVKQALSGLPCRVTEPIRGAVCAYFDFGRRETAAFRADMDALPVTEHVDVPWKSTHEGRMHACGHDGHAAMALALARAVSEAEAPLPRNLLLVFQPAEETTGGAKRIVETGLFEELNVTRIFGFHLWPDLPFGALATKAGPLFARSSEVDIDIEGVSAHIAKASEGADALLAGVRVIDAAYRMAETELPANEKRLLKFGMLRAGTVRNALSASAELRGSMRAFDDGVFDHMKRRLFEIARDAERETDAKVCVRMSEGYPPVRNDEALYRAVRERFGCELAEVDQPSMTAEDFSFYQQAVPGLFLLLGTGGGYPLHSDRFDFDDAVLGKGVEYALSLVGMP